DRTQPGAQVRKDSLVLFQSWSIIATPVFPNITVHAPGIAQVGHHEPDVGGPAFRGQTTSCEGSQAIVETHIGASVDCAQTQGLKACGHGKILQERGSRTSIRWFTPGGPAPR